MTVRLTHYSYLPSISRMLSATVVSSWRRTGKAARYEDIIFEVKQRILIGRFSQEWWTLRETSAAFKLIYARVCVTRFWISEPWLRLRLWLWLWRNGNTVSRQTGEATGRGVSLGNRVKWFHEVWRRTVVPLPPTPIICPSGQIFLGLLLFPYVSDVAACWVDIRRPGIHHF